MKDKRFGRELAKAVGLGLGTVGLIGGFAVAGTLMLEGMERQIVEGLQQASYPGVRSVTMRPAAPVQEPKAETTGPNTSDYVAPVGIVAAEVAGIAGFFAYRRWADRAGIKALEASLEPAVSIHDQCKLTYDELLAFNTIVAREFKSEQ